MRGRPREVIPQQQGRLNVWRWVFAPAQLAMMAGELLALLALACRGGGGSLMGPPPPAGEFFYVENFSQFVGGFSVQSGHLAAIAGSGTRLPFPPLALAADPKGQFLGLMELQNLATPEVQLLAIQPAGTLLLGAQVPMAGAAKLAFSGNRLLAVIDQNAEQVEVFAIQNGNLTMVSSAPTGALPADVLFNRNNRTLYVANRFGGSISVYSVSSGGAIQPLETLSWPLARGQGMAPVERLGLNSAGDKLAAVTGIGQLYVSGGERCGREAFGNERDHRFRRGKSRRGGLRSLREEYLYRRPGQRRAFRIRGGGPTAARRLCQGRPCRRARC
jgi:hypothetical protein